LRFFAFPTPAASNLVGRVAQFAIAEINPRLAVNTNLNIRYGNFEPGDNGVRWRGLPLVSPNLHYSKVGGEVFVTGGLYHNLLTNKPVPTALIQQINSATNLLMYEWELTQPSLFGLIQPTQIGRFLFDRPRLSMTNNAALPWLTAISTNLLEASGSLRLTSSNQLTFSRLSTVGLTGFELHLLADWLESPSFPAGWFSFSFPKKDRP
jgi:hypothetical protein